MKDVSFDICKDWESIVDTSDITDLPHVECEGIFVTELPKPPPFEKSKLWFDKLHPNERLYYYQTLSSTRRFANFLNIPWVSRVEYNFWFISPYSLNFSDIPKDSLDIVLASEYDHAKNFLFKRAQIFTQPETLDKRTFRRLKNQKDIIIKPPVFLSHPKIQGFYLTLSYISFKLQYLLAGGVTERHSIHGVKLMNSGPHTQITNPGYSRQTGDGNFFNY